MNGSFKTAIISHLAIGLLFAFGSINCMQKESLEKDGIVAQLEKEAKKISQYISFARSHYTQLDLADQQEQEAEPLCFNPCLFDSSVEQLYKNNVSNLVISCKEKFVKIHPECNKAISHIKSAYEVVDFIEDFLYNETLKIIEEIKNAKSQDNLQEKIREYLEIAKAETEAEMRGANLFKRLCDFNNLAKSKENLDDYFDSNKKPETTKETQSKAVLYESFEEYKKPLEEELNLKI